MTFLEILNEIGKGFWVTLLIGGASMALSTLLGLVLASLSVQRFVSVRAASFAYIQIFRGLPLLTQLFIIYFGLARLGLEFDSFTAAVIGLSMGSGAVVAEILRGGLMAVPAGQMEAAVAIGMTRYTALRLIILPQAIPHVIAPLSDFFVTLIKATAIASAVAAPEMTFCAKMLAQNTSQTPEVYLTLSAIYLAMGMPLVLILDRIERSRNRKRGR